MDPSASTTHASLLARLAESPDSVAWREFCDRYEELIRGFARRQNLQDSDCDDVVQDVLLALTKVLPNFRYDPSKGKFRGYLKTLVLHVIYQKARQKRGQVALEGVEKALGADSAATALEKGWEAEWRQYHLRQAMRKIEIEFNQRDCQAFDAYAIHGENAQATATTLGMSVDQVYQAKSRILARLTALIEEQVREEG